MKPESIVRYEFEFGFLNGQTQFFTTQEGRDRMAIDAERVRLELHHEPDAVEEVIVHRSALAYMRTTKRTVQPDMELNPDTGTLRLVGTNG